MFSSGRLLRALLPKFALNFVGFLIYRKKLFGQGTWPHYKAVRTLRKSAENPDTFSKKIRYRMAFDRRTELTTFADKVAVRRYVANRVGEKFLTTMYEVLEKDSLDLLPTNKLPRSFVIKASHGSGGVIIVNEAAPKLAVLPADISNISNWGRLLIHPDNLDWPLTNVILTKWLNRNYYWTAGHLPEWAYKNIQPKVMFEELLISPSGELSDFRFFTFNGKCEFISAGHPYYHKTGVTRDFYNLDWTLIPVKSDYPNNIEKQLCPINLNEMIKVAESLADGTDHIRVDLYNCNGRIVFGELTNYHSAGDFRFFPEVYDYEFGKSWNPQEIY